MCHRNELVDFWIQANVMLEYTYDEALVLLTNNFTQASDTVVSLDQDLDFIKDQITTTEVVLYYWPHAVLLELCRQ